uniref:Uncharacterized protein n=1 Tax=Avena sativa TaxID=4498 RepID=A0ACD5V9Q4_AVESA
MSSLTTISSGMEMEETPEVEELMDTRLSLALPIAAGTGRQPPAVQAMLPASLPPPETEASAAAAGRKRNYGPESGRDGSTPTTRRHDGKKARRVHGGRDVDNDEVGDVGQGDARKKLRLTCEQAALMEKSFRSHNVLSHDEKNDLARQLGLKPRQVEVWFQNRRARTKLKQTELDCELLRRWCERLSHDNDRLRQELAEARSSSSSAFLSRLTAATAPVRAACPSCNKLAGSRAPA